MCIRDRLLEDGTDYSATNSANVVLTNAADVDDTLEVFAYHIGSANSITISSNNNVGIGNTTPADDLSVQGTLFVSGNVSINSTIKDSSGRALLVYYANGDIAWGN